TDFEGSNPSPTTIFNLGNKVKPHGRQYECRARKENRFAQHVYRLYKTKGEEASDQPSFPHPKYLQKNQVAEFQDAGIV
ncbi:hypothetical protein, partial [Serratia rubidaea]|uniref:hypothetical protein n=1 Tax=Serratia rubidaea TaxID=61652 RepID=UPI001F226BD2